MTLLSVLLLIVAAEVVVQWAERTPIATVQPGLCSQCGLREATAREN